MSTCFIEINELKNIYINWMHLDTFDSIWNCFRDSTMLSTVSPHITFKVALPTVAHV